ncbi:2TM domain-containing protein [Lutibacter sp. Hel_I_33_5]|uniref:2TM domain-containing protein n=1 Tax=Lutibacter sp. Hel_I_33_5 TaxID=1566289 RepID=UPI0011A77327|nr:2TM domain-containing protein [Lutibacter sp. Hel_I_33_5]TVZ55156.1 2TM domain-containing protein [Lutibacter sp. Hel_I_33_5]
MDNRYTEEQQYIKAKEQVKKIKGFYAHIVVTLCVVPFLIFINLYVTPEFHWFWFPMGGLTMSIVFHWFSIFGFEKFGFGKDWEDRKIKEFMNNNN